MCADPAPDEYSYWGIAGQIHESMRYYMKPHELLVFGNDIRNTNKSHILSRIWLNSMNNKNSVLVLLERTNIVDNDYWRQINTRSWQPTDWNAIQRANELHQIIDTESIRMELF